MKRRNRTLAGIVAGVLLSSGAAVAAPSASEIHLALTSLRVALAKMGVANAMLAKPTPPSSNAEAHIGAPDRMSSREIGAIVVSTGGVINVYLTPVVGVTDGIIQLVPLVVTDKQGKKRVQYTCYSPNIRDIASAAPQCTYHAASK